MVCVVLTSCSEVKFSINIWTNFHSLFLSELVKLQYFQNVCNGIDIRRLLLPVPNFGNLDWPTFRVHVAHTPPLLSVGMNACPSCQSAVASFSAFTRLSLDTVSCIELFCVTRIVFIPLYLRPISPSLFRPKICTEGPYHSEGTDLIFKVLFASL